MSPRERRSSAPEPEGFFIPPTENPIEFGSKAIQDLIKPFVTVDLQGMFPKNYVYGMGDYDLIFHSMQSYGEHGGGFSRSDDMIVLNPKGEFESGNVEHYVGNWTNNWEFSKAKLKPTSNLEIVRHSPILIDELFKQTVEELPKQTEFVVAKAVISALGKRAGLVSKIKTISETSLQAMGEEVPVRETDEGDDVTKRETPEALRLKKMRSALSLYSKRAEIRQVILEAKRTGRASNIQSAIGNLVGLAKDAGLFSTDNGPLHKDFDKAMLLDYVTEGQPVGDRLTTDMHYYHDGRISLWQMGITNNGRLVEVALYGFGQPVRECAEHILDSSSHAAEAIIAQSVAKAFPKLIWRNV